MGQPRLFFVYFRSFHTKQYNFYNKINTKNVHPVYGTWIQTHNLTNMSCHPLPLDQGSRYFIIASLLHYHHVFAFLKTFFNYCLKLWIVICQALFKMFIHFFLLLLVQCLMYHIALSTKWNLLLRTDGNVQKVPCIVRYIKPKSAIIKQLYLSYCKQVSFITVILTIESNVCCLPKLV